nr:MAG TPA: hypothetical protein [Caudoviricetes sp.]
MGQIKSFVHHLTRIRENFSGITTYMSMMLRSSLLGIIMPQWKLQ